MGMIHEYIIKVDDSKKDIMGGMPLVEQAKELIRCKDCMYWKQEFDKENHWICLQHSFNGKVMQTTPDFFCADGMQKGNN